MERPPYESKTEPLRASTISRSHGGLNEIGIQAEKSRSGIPESNRYMNLGKVPGYHYINPAKIRPISDHEDRTKL